MIKKNQQWPAVRIVHLVGGCRAINNLDPIVIFKPNKLDGKIAQFNLSGYGALFHNLERLDIGIIGVDFYSHVLEVEGSIPPNWRPFNRIETTVWPVEEISQKWRNIGHAAFQCKNGKLWDIGSRIGHQLRVCGWRLREVSEAYNSQLRARVQRNDFKVGQRFEDGFTWLTYLSIQSFLVDACILRDYLSEFASEFVYKDVVDSKHPKITTMGRLKEKVLNKVSGSDPLTQQLKQDTSNNGWITTLGNYRDLVVHAAPLVQAENKLLAICKELNLNGDGKLPIIRCPIPENPKEILNSRSTGNHFSDFDRQFEAFVKAANGDIPMTDGMDYASTVLGRFAKLAGQIAERSPIAPQMTVFNDSNIIGDIKVKKYKINKKAGDV